MITVHVRWPGQTSGAFGLALIFLVLFASRQKERKVYSRQPKERNKKKRKPGVITFMFYVLSFACAKESFDKLRIKSRKKSTPAMMYGHCRPDSYRD